MARKPIAMRYVRDILRLKHQNQLSVREIAGSCGLPASKVGGQRQLFFAADDNYFFPVVSVYCLSSLLLFIG